jgi:hypothetical protein
VVSSENVCARLKQFGYSQSKSVKLYGQVLHLLSDPYLDGEQFVVEAFTQQTCEKRVVRIPKFIVGSARAA